MGLFPVENWVLGAARGERNSDPALSLLPCCGESLCVGAWGGPGGGGEQGVGGLSDGRRGRRCSGQLAGGGWERGRE